MTEGAACATPSVQLPLRPNSLNALVVDLEGHRDLTQTGRTGSDV